MGEYVPFLPHILDLTYVQNTGAAFSLFSEHTWLLTLSPGDVGAAAAGGLARGFFRHPFGRTSLALLLAGAVGNLIDRAFQAKWWICSMCLYGVRRVQCGGHLRGGWGSPPRSTMCGAAIHQVLLRFSYVLLHLGVKHQFLLEARSLFHLRLNAASSMTAYSFTLSGVAFVW